MVSNQNEFNNIYPKEITEIKITNKDFAEEQLVIEDYSNLETLYLRGIDSLDKLILRNLKQLQKCIISDCGMQELIIESCPQIKELKADENSLINLEFLKNLKNLRKLNVDDNAELASGLEYLPKGMKFSCENTKLDYQEEDFKQKYENLKGVMTSVAKEAKKEILKGIEAKEEISEQSNKVIKTDEIVLDLTKGIEGLKEVKKELEINLEESEKKVQKLEKELTEAKVRAEERQKKIEELTKEQEIDQQTPINEKTINFLRTKSTFLNVRQKTIGELKKCFITLENKFGRQEVIGEVGNVVSGVGGMFDVVTFGIPGAIGEVIKAGDTFSQIILTKRGNEEFQLSLKDEKELVQLHKDYDSLVSFIHGSKELGVNILNLKDRTRDGKARAFNTNYEIFSILESKNVWKHRTLTLERMEETINALSKNHEQLETEWEEQFEKLETKLGKEKTSFFFQEQQVGAKTHRLQNQLEELINSAKEKLKSTHWRKKDKRNKEREIMLSDLLNMQAEITRSGDTTDRQRKITSLRKELLEIATEHNHKDFKTELDNICQVQIELTRSELELENLKKHQPQIQIPPK